MELNVETIALVLLISALVAMAARRFRIPYTVGLVLAGIVFGLLPFTPKLELTKELIFSVLLPPLIFEATLFIRWRELLYNLPVILTFAIPGVLVSAGLTGLGMFYFAGWTWQNAALFGALIAATDPVSVIATFKEAGVRGRLRLLVEGESLFNDGAAAVSFFVVLAVIQSGTFDPGQTLRFTLWTIFGGLLCGALVAGVVSRLAQRTDDHLIELSLSAVAAYGSFLLAEHFGASGILSTLTAGILIGNFGLPASYTDKGRVSVADFWEFAAFISNSLIFFLIGARQVGEDYTSAFWPIAIAILFVMLGRAAAIYPLSALFNKTRLRVERNHQHILFWSGLRGALALALALGLPPEIPQREEIVTVAFGVVAFSIFVQGLTIVPFLRRELPDTLPENLSQPE